MGAAPPCSGGLDASPHASGSRMQQPAARAPYSWPVFHLGGAPCTRLQPTPRPASFTDDPLWCAVTSGCRSSEEEVRAAAAPTAPMPVAICML